MSENIFNPNVEKYCKSQESSMDLNLKALFYQNYCTSQKSI